MSDLPVSALPSPTRRSAAWATAPMALLAAALLLALVLLLAVRTLPIGPMYWDLYIYFDAANRIGDGQLPNVDFFAPVGPLGYWVFAGALKLFPNAQPLLLVDWSLLAVSAPLMALVLADVAPRSRGVAFALLVPFLFFSLLPFNVEAFSSFPGVDGFGIYNRQGARLLYVLAAALVFCRRPRLLGLAVAGVMLALFLVKITGFVAGGLLCALAFLAGRVKLSTAIAVSLAFAGSLALVEAATGVVGAYLSDIARLVVMNEGDLVSRFLQAASIHFGRLLPCLLLVATLLVLDFRAILASGRTALRTRRPAAFFDHPAFWLAAFTFAALFFETQNTGGQAFIFVWPVLLLTLIRLGARPVWQTGLIGALVAACILPTVTTLAERSGRALIGALRYERLDAADLGPLGAVTQRGELVRRSAAMLPIYAANPDFFHRFVEMGELPSTTLFSEPDYQLSFLRTIDEAVAGIGLYEMANGVRFETILNLGFVNPVPFLMDRHAPRHVSIGADPFRTVPPPDGEVAESIRGTDLLLYAKCPETAANRDLLKLYEPFLGDHRRVSLGRCWDGFVRSALAP